MPSPCRFHGRDRGFWLLRRNLRPLEAPERIARARRTALIPRREPAPPRFGSLLESCRPAPALDPESIPQMARMAIDPRAGNAGRPADQSPGLTRACLDPAD